MDLQLLRKRFEEKTCGVPPSDCLLWMAAVNPGGYGKLQVDKRLRQSTHVAFYLKHGRWPNSRLLRHTCDVPYCVNGDHLLEGAHLDNAHDAVSRGRNAHSERHGMAKLSREQAKEIRSASGLNYEIAYWYGVTPSQVARIRNRKSWIRLCD